MTLIDQIKAEITAIKDLTGVGLNEYDMGHENGVCETCDRLLSFIEALEKEQPQGVEAKVLQAFTDGSAYIECSYEGRSGDKLIVQIRKA